MGMVFEIVAGRRDIPIASTRTDIQRGCGECLRKAG